MCNLPFCKGPRQPLGSACAPPALNKSPTHEKHESESDIWAAAMANTGFKIDWNDVEGSRKAHWETNWQSNIQPRIEDRMRALWEADWQSKIQPTIKSKKARTPARHRSPVTHHSAPSPSAKKATVPRENTNRVQKQQQRTRTQQTTSNKIPMIDLIGRVSIVQQKYRESQAQGCNTPTTPLASPALNHAAGPGIMASSASNQMDGPNPMASSTSNHAAEPSAMATASRTAAPSGLSKQPMSDPTPFVHSLSHHQQQGSITATVQSLTAPQSAPATPAPLNRTPAVQTYNASAGWPSDDSFWALYQNNSIGLGELSQGFGKTTAVPGGYDGGMPMDNTANAFPSSSSTLPGQYTSSMQIGNMADNDILHGGQCDVFKFVDDAAYEDLTNNVDRSLSTAMLNSQDAHSPMPMDNNNYNNNNTANTANHGTVTRTLLGQHFGNPVRMENTDRVDPSGATPTGLIYDPGIRYIYDPTAGPICMSQRPHPSAQHVADATGRPVVFIEGNGRGGWNATTFNPVLPGVEEQLGVPVGSSVQPSQSWPRHDWPDYSYQQAWSWGS